jgi:hypothetical protein
MGADSAYEAKNSYNPVAALKVSPSNSAEKTFNSAMANMDKVLANPDASKKQIVAAMDRLNSATDKYAKSVFNSITPVQLPPKTEPPTSEGFSGGRGASITATPPSPAPEVFSAKTFTAAPPVKTATLDIILFDEESVPTDGMFDQIFENIGGQELISITRSDIVNGQKISYQPIKNLSAIQQRYNPNNILSLQQTADKFFAGFSIKLEDKIPEIGNGANGENVYLNASGDLVIEFININADEQVETLISSSGTIYEADLGDYTS